MRIASIILVLSTLLACGEDEGDPEDGGRDAAAEGATGDATNDAGSDAEAVDPDAADPDPAEEDGGPDGDGGGSDADDAGSASEDGGGEPAAHQAQLSDALDATIEIEAPSASWTKGTDQGTLILLPAGRGEISVGFTFTFSGAPAEGETYDQTRSGVSCALIATRAGDRATWDAVRGLQGASDQGTCSLTLSSVEETLDLDAVKEFATHGSVEGTLLPQQGSGAEGGVTLRAKF